MSERGVLGICAAVMLLTAERSSAYPPNYLAWSPLWTATAAVAGLLCVAAMSGRRILVVVSGAAMVAASVSRSIVIGGQLLIGTTPSSQRASFAIASSTWMLIAVLCWQVWAHVLIPWTACRGGRRDP